MSKYNDVERAVIERAFEVGGFPIFRKKLIELWSKNSRADFDELVERMRTALMQIESDNMTMEQIGSAAHICAVIAYKLK